MTLLSRRALLAGLAIVPVAGCVMSDEPPAFDPIDYGPRFDGGRSLRAISADEMPASLRRQLVPFELEYSPGHVVIDPDPRTLYFVVRGGFALRYNIAVGSDALRWSGEAEIGLMEEWPTGPSPAPVIGEPMPTGFAPGSEELITTPAPSLPFGARAMSLRSLMTGADTGLKIHGTPLLADGSRGQPTTGGYRLINHEIIDLYSRVEVGTRVTVL